MVKIVYLTDSIISSKRANVVHVMKMCEAIAKLGHDVTLVAQDKSNEDIEKIIGQIGIELNFKFKIFRILNFPGQQYWLALKAFFFIHSIKPDIVYGRFLLGCFLACFKFPTILEVHSINESRRIDSFVLQRISKLRNFRFLVSITESLKNKIIEVLHVDERKIVILPDAASTPKVVEPIKFEKSKIHIGYVGSLFSGKGMEIIEKIVKLVVDKPYHFHIVGGFPDQINYWQTQVMTRNVTFHGMVSQSKVYEYIKGFDICLLPNQRIVKTGKVSDIGSYTSPLKMFEYMANSKAIIASDLPVLREILDEQIAVFGDPESPASWVSSIEYLEDESLRIKIGEMAFDRFRNNYTWDKRAEKIISEVNV